MAERLRLGRSHADTVYLQTGDQPSLADERVAVFMGPDAEQYAATLVAIADVAPNAAAVAAAALRAMADEIDRGPTFPLPPTVISALIRERADALEATA